MLIDTLWREDFERFQEKINWKILEVRAKKTFLLDLITINEYQSLNWPILGAKCSRIAA